MEGKLIRSTGEEREALGKRGMLGPRILPERPGVQCVVWTRRVSAITFTALP